MLLKQNSPPPPPPPEVYGKMNSCNMLWYMLAVMVFSAKKEGLCSTIMHYAGIVHINFWGVLHVLLNFMWPFLSPGVTVVPVHMTIHVEGCHICEHHLS